MKDEFVQFIWFCWILCVSVIGKVASLDPRANNAVLAIGKHEVWWSIHTCSFSWSSWTRASKSSCTVTFVSFRTQLAVDLALVSPSVKVGSLFQFVGEVQCMMHEPEPSKFIVRAQFGRCVDGLDIPLFKKVRLWVQKEHFYESEFTNRKVSLVWYKTSESPKTVYTYTIRQVVSQEWDSRRQMRTWCVLFCTLENENAICAHVVIQALLARRKFLREFDSKG